MPRVITFAEAIREALDQAMAADESVIVFGLGVDDPKAIFGTTASSRLPASHSHRMFVRPSLNT